MRIVGKKNTGPQTKIERQCAFTCRNQLAKSASIAISPMPFVKGGVKMYRCAGAKVDHLAAM
jgi:hypothetical protein